MFIKYSKPKFKNINKIISFFIVIIIFIYFVGCTATERCKTLSVFFDGVSSDSCKEFVVHNIDSINTDTTSSLLKDKSIASKKTVYHPPYQEKQCVSCHNKNMMGTLNQDMPDLCFQCHEDFNKKYKVLHGPVGGGQCTMCHNPHMTTNKKLLKRTGQSLCLYCHTSEQVMKAEVHKDINEINCTECHNPHGGEDRYVLR